MSKTYFFIYSLYNNVIVCFYKKREKGKVKRKLLLFVYGGSIPLELNNTGDIVFRSGYNYTEKEIKGLFQNNEILQKLNDYFSNMNKNSLYLISDSSVYNIYI